MHETYKGEDGRWVSPAEITVSEKDGKRTAVHKETGETITIGSIEKMSKSKKNTVDPTDIIETYGADTARWFMLSDSPPERDVIWTEAGAEGAHRLHPAHLAACGGHLRVFLVQTHQPNQKPCLMKLWRFAS